MGQNDLVTALTLLGATLRFPGDPVCFFRFLRTEEGRACCQMSLAAKTWTLDNAWHALLKRISMPGYCCRAVVVFELYFVVCGAFERLKILTPLTLGCVACFALATARRDIRTNILVRLFS